MGPWRGLQDDLDSVAAKQVPVRLLVGGFPLLATSEAEIDRLVRALHEG